MPFTRPVTVIGLAVPVAVILLGVEVTVYDADGRERVVLERARRKAGNHVVRWSGTDESNSLLPPGLYHIVLKRDGQVGR